MRDTLPPLSAWTSGLVATAVGFGGTIALVVQAIHPTGTSNGGSA